MKYIYLLALMLSVGCVNVDVDEQDAGHTRLSTIVGPDHDADVQLDAAIIWIVPTLPAGDGTGPEEVTWTLLHPDRFVRATIRRTCTNGIVEPFLWLSDPPNWGASSALATFDACGGFGAPYSTVEVAFDGAQWIGLSATGAATLLPPN